jgi:hypothetical protein
MNPGWLRWIFQSGRNDTDHCRTPLSNSSRKSTGAAGTSEAVVVAGHILSIDRADPLPL